VTPVLPEEAAKEVADIEARIEELNGTWLSPEIQVENDAALDEAIGLAERVMALRLEHQGNTEGVVRWRNAKGEPAEWYEVTESRLNVADLRRVRGLDAVAQAELVSLNGTDAEVGQLYAEGRYAEAQELTQRQLDIRRRVLGNEHADTLRSIGTMGLLLMYQGRLTEAEPYNREALDGFRRVLGDEHPETLTNLGNLGSLLESQGRLPEAEMYYREALDGFRRVLGDKHTNTLISNSNLGKLLLTQGRLSEAEPYCFEAMNGFRQVLGDTNPDTLISINNMGGLLESQGRRADAEPYYREALDGFRRVLGEQHPYTLFSISNMGALLSAQGRLAEAEPYYREVLEARRRVLGDDHPQTLLSINNLGSLLMSQGRMSEATSYIQEALEIHRRVLGNEHPNTLDSIAYMASLQKSQGRLSEAETYYREALEGRRRVLGDEHPDTLMSINNMGVLLESLGRRGDAEQHYHEALDGYRRLLGDEHPDTLTSVNNMAVLLEYQGRLSEAETYYRNALSTAEGLRLDVNGDASARARMAGAVNLPGIAAGYARVLLAQGRAAEALSVLERGRGRAGLDLLAGGRSTAEDALRATANVDRMSRYDAALAAEQVAQLAVFEAEARLSNAPDEQKATRRDIMLSSRRTLSEKTAAVFAELRGLVSAVDPLGAEQMLEALAPDETLLMWSWTEDGVLALVAREGVVRGVTVAKGKNETTHLNAVLNTLRSRIASRPSAGDTPYNTTLLAARDAAVPEALADLLAGSSSVITIVEGPLAGIPIELLVPDVRVVYAPSATIALRSRHDVHAGSDNFRSATMGTGVVLGDPIFAGNQTRPEPEYPKAGILLAMVTEDSNAEVAGLKRGDVLLTYGVHELTAAQDLGPAIASTAEALTTRSAAEDERPITVTVWRATQDGHGKTIAVNLAPGRLGVELSEAAPADGLRSMAALDRSAEVVAANESALEQVRFYGGTLSQLPATRLEATAVAAMLGDDAILLLGKDATAPKLREAIVATSPRVLHLATHGLMGSSDHPLLASIALTTPAEPTGEDNGFVTLGDILSTWVAQLHGTELVVLSACDTASAVRQGDTMMALPLGLLIGGADSVLASLWKVDDKATALLMARFYANWFGITESVRDIDGVTYSAGQPMSKLAALREAQQWLASLTVDQVDRITTGIDAAAIIQGTSREPSARRGRVVKAPDSQADSRPYDHPFYWSAFVLYGSPE